MPFRDVFADEHHRYKDAWEIKHGRLAATISSAGWNSGALGRSALRGLVRLKASTRLMDVSHAQVKKLLYVLEVAKIRAAETFKAVDTLHARGKLQYPGGLYFQLLKGPGLLDPDYIDPKAGNAGPPVPIPKPPGGLGAAKADKEWEKFPTQPPDNPDAGKPPGAPKPGASAIAGDKEQAPVIDWEGFQIQKDFKELVSKTHQNSHHSRFLNRNIAHAARMHNVGWRSAADLLKYPGAPVEPLPKILRKPMINRPRDLSPGWMDFMFASTKGSDPYEEWPEGTSRKLIMDITPGENIQTPFGNNNMPKPFAAEDQGQDSGEKPEEPDDSASPLPM